MPGLFWKLPLVVLLALVVAAAKLVTHARDRHAARTPVTLSPALRPPPDGLARAKRAAADAVATATLREAIRTFHECEGRAPLSLNEVAANGYLRDADLPVNLHRFRYDPETLNVIDRAR